MFVKTTSLFQRLKNDFDLNGISEVYFWKSEWEDFEPGDRYGSSVSLKYILFRTFFMLYFIGVMASTMACREEMSIYFIYLTNLTFVIQLIYGVLYFIDILWIRFIQQNKVSLMIYSEEEPKLRILEKIIWILINLVNVVPYIVTVGYWGFLYVPDEDATTCQTVNDYLVHASNSILALIDFMIISVPIRRTHAIFPIVFGLAYGIFTVLYEVAGGYYGIGKENIYPLLDWKQSPGSATVAVVVATVCAGMGHLVICWGLFRLRNYMSQCISNRRKY